MAMLPGLHSVHDLEFLVEERPAEELHVELAVRALAHLLGLPVEGDGRRLRDRS